ncbi:MAG: protein kinase [Gemmatimonadota bacterium]|nr:MAG: protein kinase [Gemmatimonadota bacterium]
MATCPDCGTLLSQDSLCCPRCGKPAPGEQEDDLLASSASDPTGLLDRLRTATAGEFKIVRELGRGGMGRVYLAHELALERRVALKVLPPALSEHAEIVQRFQREARTAGKLNHPNIVAVFQVSERAGLHFFTMPYVAGPSLRQVLKQTPQLSAELCRRYLREAADALSYAHGRDVIHRDIKPENMLLEGSRDGRLLLTDFGIAKALGTATTLTRPGDMMGTPYFMSPEQCEGVENIDGRADQYSLGLVAYEMLAGCFPFSADSLAGIVYKHVHEYPESLGKVRPDVPADLRAVIERAIRKDPNERFPNMGELLRALGPARAGPRERQEAAAPPSQARRRRRSRWVALGGTLALAVVAAGFAIWQQRTSAAGHDEARLAEINVRAEQEGLAVPGDTTGLDSTSSGGPSGAGTAPEGGFQAPRGGRPGETGGANTGPSERDELAGERARAQQARSEAEDAREAARLAGADTIFAARFAQVDRLLSGARSDLRDGRIVTAAVGFATARSDFEELERQARLRLQELANAAAVTQLDSSGAQTETPPPEGPEGQAGDTDDAAAAEPAAPAPPREAITSLIESYREALEAYDMTRLEQQVYQATIPGEDAELYDIWFERADELSVSIEVQGMDVRLHDAEVRVKQKMRFRLDRTGEWRSWDVSLRMFFTLADEGWRLERVQR